MQTLLISELQVNEQALEVVERKGRGHPDTICDALAETLSRNLCREYRRRFGEILHHNVDKALLCGGRAAPAFGAGEILSPIRIFLAGRATGSVGGVSIPLEEIAIEGSRAWLRDNLRALDPIRHVAVHQLIEPGSADLRNLFARTAADVPLANDTSIGVGYAPMSPLEALVLEIERHITAPGEAGRHPAWGEDVKVMGIRRGARVQITVACAIIGAHVHSMGDYLAAKAALDALVGELATAAGFEACEVAVNAADRPAEGSIYLTVSGTSAEAGDDGQVGRGNRVNGLITPCRPMSLEAAAGKNPVSHVGKLYNVVAHAIATSLVADVPDVEAAHCLLVSRIGAPVTEPAAIDLKLAMRDGRDLSTVTDQVGEAVVSRLSAIPKLLDAFVEGTIPVY